MNNHDLGGLHFLIAIAESGSVTAAAEKLCLSQPAISYRLARAEESLGAPIFTRNGKRLELTPIGKRALTAARTIENEVFELKRDIATMRDGDTQTLRLSTQCYTTYRWLPLVLKSVRRAFPEFDIEIDATATSNSLAALKSNKIDIALAFSDPDPEHFVSETIMKDEIFALLPAAHRLAGKEYVTPAQIAHEKAIVYSTSGSPLVNEFLAPAGRKPAAITGVPLTEAIVELVRAGAGVTAMAGWVLARQNMNELVTARLGKRGLHRTWRLFYKKNRDSDLLQQFISELRRSIGQAL